MDNFKDKLRKLFLLIGWEMPLGADPLEFWAFKTSGYDKMPCEALIDVTLADGIGYYAMSLDADSEDGLNRQLITTCRHIINGGCGKKVKEEMPQLYAVYSQVRGMMMNASFSDKIASMASAAWNGGAARRALKRKCDAMYAQEPDAEAFADAIFKIMDIWGFTESDIDALWYFILQCKSDSFDKSLNKSLYFWGEDKMTGKTTIAGMIASILNGDSYHNSGVYTSKFGREMQLNPHDIPAATLYNCVVMDEAMPRDTRKSYGILKEMITNDLVHFNPKFKAPLMLKAKRNYIFTSNDSIEDYIQDEEDRRFYAIKFNKIKTPLTRDEIYNIWKQFIVNCAPYESQEGGRDRTDIYTWYKSFKNEKGIENQDIKDYQDRILNLRQEICNQHTSFTLAGLYQLIALSSNVLSEKKLIRKAWKAMFSDCSYRNNNSLYSRSAVLDKFDKIFAEREKSIEKKTEQDE